MNICELNHSRSRDARALHGHNKTFSSHIPREFAGFKVAQSANFRLAPRGPGSGGDFAATVQRLPVLCVRSCIVVVSRRDPPHRIWLLHSRQIRRQAAFAGFASPLARRSGKVFALALERFQNECLVRFDDARQRGRFVQVESGKKSVTPAKRGRTIYRTTLQPPLRRILRSSRPALAPSNGRFSVIQPTTFPSTDRMSSGTPCSDTEACRSPAQTTDFIPATMKATKVGDSTVADLRKQVRRRLGPTAAGATISGVASPSPSGPIRPGPPAWFRRYRHRDIPQHRSLRPTPNPETPSSAAQNSEARFRFREVANAALSTTIPQCGNPPFSHLAT